MTHDVRRIAVFRARGVHDLLLAVPALQALRVGFPEAEITLIGRPGAESFARQFRQYVDRFVAFPGDPGTDEAVQGVAGIDQFVRAQREYGYDLVLQMQDATLASNQLAADLGGWVTAGYFVGDPPDELNVAARCPDDRDELMRALGLVELIGCPSYAHRLVPLFDNHETGLTAVTRTAPGWAYSARP